jgi:hypothetical protein
MDTGKSSALTVNVYELRMYGKGKGKNKGKGNFTLEQAVKTQKGRRGIAQLFL